MFGILTQEVLIDEARSFCGSFSDRLIPALFGITDGKAVGTHIEHEFKDILKSKYAIDIGNSASGIDLPSMGVDIKTTSIKQPQSSCPFKAARQKVYGLGYHLLLFVYDKNDDTVAQTAHLQFVNCVFIDKSRTADYQTTRGLLEILARNANRDDVIAFLEDRMLPVDEIGKAELANEVLAHPPLQGYLTISNALQWRLQYGRIVALSEPVDGITRIVG
jgi:hypothetical protein